MQPPAQLFLVLTTTFNPLLKFANHLNQKFGFMSMLVGVEASF
jgi:hypothetical protein